MKEFTILSNMPLFPKPILDQLESKPFKYGFRVQADSVTDGYHTMSELYDHRRALTAALLNVLSWESLSNPELGDPTFKSKLHSDGTMFDDYFICGFKFPNIGMVTYHYDLKYWDQFRIPEVERAPKWDGHTSQDVIERLLKL